MIFVEALRTDIRGSMKRGKGTQGIDDFTDDILMTPFILERVVERHGNSLTLL